MYQSATTVNEPETSVGLRGYRIVDPARDARRRSGIVRAAARVFSSRSFDSATMDDIAQELGVSKGVLYYQFRSKEEVFTEILVLAISEALRRLEVTVATSGSPLDRLREALRELIAFNLDEETPNHGAMLIIGNIRSLSPSRRETIRALQRAYQNVVIGLIREGTAAGLFDVADPRVAAMNMLNAANGVSTWFVRDRDVNANEVAEQVSGQLVRGIAAGPAAPNETTTKRGDHVRQ